MGARLLTLLPFSFSMEDTDLMRKEDSLCVVQLVLDSGERLPCLVETATWLPVRLATRWAVRHRRYQVQASTLKSNLYSLKKLYEWAWYTAEIELDQYLLSGQLLSARAIESLAAYIAKDVAGPTSGIVAASTYNKHLFVYENFLKWSLDPQNRGGSGRLSLAELAYQRGSLEFLFRSLRLRHHPSPRIEPLSKEEVEAIRRAVGPQRKGSGGWRFAEGGFTSRTALRNWLMFETALELGLRRGELLKLRLDSLPRGAGGGIKIMRYPDDVHDSRATEPAVKTAERMVPASRNLLSAIRHYVTAPPPHGRVKGKSPYLFVAQSGQPLSVVMADKVIQAIGRVSGVVPLSWHRLRHTWAEQMAERLKEESNGLDILMYLGGWTARESVSHYVQRTIARQAHEVMQQYQTELYVPTDGEGEVAG